MCQITFIILHYKDKQATELCVQSILRMDGGKKQHILIIDNDSNEPDEVRQLLKEQYADWDNVFVLPIYEKSGFSRANNIAYQYAKENFKQDFILMCNNDIEFTQKDSIKRIENIYKDTRFSVLGPNVIRRGTGERQNPMDTQIRNLKQTDYTIHMNQFALKYFDMVYPILYWHEKILDKRRMKNKAKNREFYEKRHENIVPFGACLIFSKDYFDNHTLAFFPETNFFYEEYILAYQCKKEGYRIIYDPSLVIMHESGASTKEKYKSKKNRMRFQLEQTANACEIYRRLIE